MNVFDNQLVLEADEGSIRFRNVPLNQDKCLILYTGPNPNGNLVTLTGSVAFGPSGSWENVSPGGAGSVWQLVGTSLARPDGFLAPNEFYVDATQVGPGPSGREVSTIPAALALADVLFPAGIAVTLRLREGQNHIWASGTAPSTRDVTIWSQGQISGEEINPVAAGRIILQGAGVGLRFASSRRRLEIRNLTIGGALTVRRGWDVVFREVTFNNTQITVNQGGGAGLDVGVTFDRCCDTGDPLLGTTKSLRMATTNHAPPGANMTRWRLEGCTFNPILSVVEPSPFFSAGNSRVLIRGCSFTGRNDVAVGFFDSPAFPTQLTFLDTVITFHSPFDVGKLFSGGKGPNVKFFGSCRVNVISPLTGTPVNDWSIGEVSQASGPLLVENGRPPRNPFAGLVMCDERVADPLESGRLGPITKRVFTSKGLAFTGGRKVYGSCITPVGLPPVEMDVTWYTPTVAGTTTTALPIPVNQNVRVTGWVIARRVNPGPSQVAAFGFDATVQKIGGVATFVAAPVLTTFYTSSANIDFKLGLDVQGNLKGVGRYLGGDGWSLEFVVELTYLAI